LGRQHAVLPSPTNRALHDINRTWLELEQRDCIARRAWIEGTKAHPPPSCQGKSDDDTIDRLVTMPANRRTGAVFAHQRMNKGGGIDRQPLCDSLLQLDKGLRQRPARKRVVVVVVVRFNASRGTEVHHASLGEVLLKARLAKRQRRNRVQQGFFLLPGDVLRLVYQPVRQLLRGVEEFGLS